MDAYQVEPLAATVRYHDLPGRDPAFVFLHGLGSASSSCFPRVVREAAFRNQRLLLIDLLGYGFSDRPAGFDYTMEAQAEIVAALLRALPLERAVVIGHSMGGSIGVLLASAHPELVAHLMSAEGNLDPGPGFVSGIITADDEPAFVSTGHRRLVQRVQQAGYPSFAGTVAIADPAALHRSAASLIAPRSRSYREQLAALAIPKTYIFGERTLPHPDFERLRADGVDVRVVPDAGHNMMEENPRGFAEVVGGALDGRP